MSFSRLPFQIKKKKQWNHQQNAKKINSICIEDRIPVERQTSEVRIVMWEGVYSKCPRTSVLVLHLLWMKPQTLQTI